MKKIKVFINNLSRALYTSEISEGSALVIPSDVTDRCSTWMEVNPAVEAWVKRQLGEQFSLYDNYSSIPGTVTLLNEILYQKEGWTKEQWEDIKGYEFNTYCENDMFTMIEGKLCRLPQTGNISQLRGAGSHTVKGKQLVTSITVPYRKRYLLSE